MILPNPKDAGDEPIKYALQLDNPYKIGYFSYLFGIEYNFKLLFSGTEGGDEELYKSIPMVTGTPTVLIGEGYLTLYAELEGEGKIYACAVMDSEKNNAKPPKKF